MKVALNCNAITILLVIILFISFPLIVLFLNSSHLVLDADIRV